MDFTEDEKATAFNQISERYYKRNFGTMSKTDFETLLFHIYIEHLLDKNEPFDDYTMSKSLGITQSKVRNLKLRKELQYPREGFEWKESFADSIRNAAYDDTTRLVKMIVSDVNVLTELRYYMETNGWYDEYHLNPKLFQCRLDFFLKLCSSLDKDGFHLNMQAEKTLKELKNKAGSEREKSAIGCLLSGFAEDGMRELSQVASKAIIIEVLKCIPFGGVAAKAIGCLLEVMQK